MKVSEREFLRIIAQHFNPDGELSVSKVNLPEIFSLARKHNILPLICNVLFPSCASDELFKREKTAAISCYLAQTVKSAKFLSVYEELLSLNFRPVCVKGVTLRALYADGDLRPSGDEDLLISKQEEERFEKAIKGLGFELKRTGINERTYSDPETGLVIEAHTSLFCESGALGETLKTLFEAEEKNT
ncbi:MAG: nucleotidyltransferase family protein, partial [Clostridia bacterium]|nr:nucleotidyltransferase family protein [Clostridia bacterium]